MFNDKIKNKGMQFIPFDMLDMVFMRVMESNALCVSAEDTTPPPVVARFDKAGETLFIKYFKQIKKQSWKKRIIKKDVKDLLNKLFLSKTLDKETFKTTKEKLLKSLVQKLPAPPTPTTLLSAVIQSKTTPKISSAPNATLQITGGKNEE
jgi:hypothetical protein